MTKRLFITWVIAVILALIVGPLLGRVLARIVVYSRPSPPVILHMDGCTCPNPGDCGRRHSAPQKGKRSI
jgi:hypothetical protein